MIRGVAHLPDGRRIITCSLDGSLRQWDLDSGAQIGNDWHDDEGGTPITHAERRLRGIEIQHEGLSLHRFEGGMNMTHYIQPPPPRQ